MTNGSARRKDFSSGTDLKLTSFPVRHARWRSAVRIEHRIIVDTTFRVLEFAILGEQTRWIMAR